MPLPLREQQAWDYYRGFQETHGYAPTITEIQRGLGWATHVQASNVVKRLRKKGYLVPMRAKGEIGLVEAADGDSDQADDLATFQLAWKDEDMLLDLVADGLMAGLVASDAVQRAKDAQAWLRSHFKVNRPNEKDQRIIRLLCRAAMRARGADRGVTLAQRAIEAARLMKEP